jgi:tetratricopeptide (TPR) repeat protein
MRQTARAAVAAHPADERAQHLAALADLDEVLSSDRHQKTRALLDEERERIGTAVALLRRQWDTARERDAPPGPEHLALCGNLALGLFMLGEGREALAVARQGLALVPDDEDMIVRAASIAIEGVDPTFARELLPRLPKTPEGLALRFRLQLGARAWPELRMLLSEHLVDIPPVDQGIARTVARLADLAMTGQPVTATDLETVAHEVANDARASILVASFAQEHGLGDVADAAFASARAALQQDDHVASRLTVAHHAEQRGDASLVADLLLGHVDESRDGPHLRMLVRALVNDLPIRERAIRFFERLPEAVLEEPTYLYGLGLMHLNRGALSEAEAALGRAVTAAPDRADCWLALISVLYRMRRNADAGSALASLDLRHVDCTPTEKMKLAHALRASGESAKAIAYAYDVLRSARNDQTVAMGYVGIVLLFNDGGFPMADVVAEDAWFSFADEDGSMRSYLIEGEADRPADGILSPSHPLAAAALGRRAGETFSLASPYGKSRTSRIVEVKHKFLHAAHEVMATFNDNFPDATGFYRISMRDGDVRAALDMVRRTSEGHRRLADLYLEDHLPLCLVATRSDRDTIGLAEYIRSLDRGIKACAGDLPERAAAHRLIEERRGHGAVLDTYAAWTLATMDAIDVLADVFGSGRTPPSSASPKRPPSIPTPSVAMRSAPLAVSSIVFVARRSPPSFWRVPRRSTARHACSPTTPEAGALRGGSVASTGPYVSYAHAPSTASRWCASRRSPGTTCSTNWRCARRRAERTSSARSPPRRVARRHRCRPT